MPNPVFQTDVDVSLDYVAFHELGRVSITLKNTGQVESRNTKAIVFVYLENDLESPVTTKIIDFGTIATGEQVKKEIAGLDSFVYTPPTGFNEGWYLDNGKSFDDIDFDLKCLMEI